MANKIYISATPVTPPSYSIVDLGGFTIISGSTINLNLLEQFELDDITESVNLQTALDFGYITAKDEFNNNITNFSNAGAFQLRGAFDTNNDGTIDNTDTPSTASIIVSFDSITDKPTLISSSLQFTTITNPFTGSFTGSFAGYGHGLRHIMGHNVAMMTLGGIEWSLDDMMDEVHSAGLISGAQFSVSGSTVLVNSGSCVIRNANYANAPTYKALFNATSSIFGPNSVHYFGIEYNNGNPRIISKTVDYWNNNTEFPIGVVVTEDDADDIYFLSNPVNVGDHIVTMNHRFYDTSPFERSERQGGLTLTAISKSFTVSEGTVWDRALQYEIATLSSITDKFNIYCKSGSFHSESYNHTELDTNRFDLLGNGTLTPLSQSYFTNRWIFIDVQTNKLLAVYGNQQFVSSSLAIAESKPVRDLLPLRIKEMGYYAGQIIVQSGSSTVITYNSYDSKIQGSVSVGNGPGGTNIHNDLNGLQGGTIDEYYHLSAAEYANVVYSSTFNTLSSSLSSRITQNTQDDLLVSSSLASRITTTNSNISSISSSINTRINTISSSFSTRITTNTQNDLLVSSSLASRVTIISSSLSTNTTNDIIRSGSFASRLTVLETAPGNSFAASASFSTRITNLETNYAVSASGTTTTTTTTFPNILNAMSIANVPAGSYELNFSTDIQGNTNNQVVTFRAYIGATAVAASDRVYQRPNAQIRTGMSIAGMIIKVPTTSNVTIDWITSAGTATAGARNLSLRRIK